MRRTCLGFSLIELVVALVVVMTLVALALPRFRIFIARSRQAEAIHNMGVIRTLLDAWLVREYGFGRADDTINNYPWLERMGNGTSTNYCRAIDKKNEIGFRVEDCEALRYNYESSPNGMIKAENDGTGRWLIYPGCRRETDVWRLFLPSPSGIIKNSANVIAACSD